jgi:hypothetical protein
MALDIYWKEWQHERYLGSLEIDTPLENLLDEFGNLTGIPIDPYGDTRLYSNLWFKLLALAIDRAYPVHRLKEITAGLPEDQLNGVLFLRGD